MMQFGLEFQDQRSVLTGCFRPALVSFLFFPFSLLFTFACHFLFTDNKNRCIYLHENPRLISTLPFLFALKTVIPVS